MLRGLAEAERRVYLVLKALLSTLKAEPWMPREVKANFTWWDSRSWKIMVPAGFAMKNAFLKRLEQKRRDEQLDSKQYGNHINLNQDNLRLDWTSVKQAVIGLLRDMCTNFQDPVIGLESLVPAKIFAYFGGEFERPKIGEGAPEIIKILEEDW